jgi:hypothetical protein
LATRGGFAFALPDGIREAIQGALRHMPRIETRGGEWPEFHANPPAIRDARYRERRGQGLEEEPQLILSAAGEDASR